MSASPALLALTEPSKVPAAALTMLTALAAAFAAQAHLMGSRAALMMTLARVATAGRAAVEAALTGGPAAAADNAGTIGLAAARLFDEMAARAGARERFLCMRAAAWSRRLYACTTLVVSEHAPSARLERTQGMPAVRILPGAETAMVALGQDPLVAGSIWDLDALATRLALYVRTT